MPDEADEIAAAIAELAEGAAVVLTTGGTGVAPRDVTPEATRSVIDREAPGIAEAIRADSLAKTPHALLSRGVAGVHGADAGRQPPGLARRLPRRLRRAAAGARARARPARRGRDGAQADVTTTAVSLPRRFASLVKLEHTVFALPFAYVGMLLALGESPPAADWLWVTVAMVGARTLAMGLNRLIDAEIDARNPRTASRELPAGTLVARAGARRSAPRALARLPRRRLPARPDRALALADPGRLLRRLPVPEARHLALPSLARRLARARAGRRVGRGDRRAARGRRGRSAGAVALWVAGFDLFYSLFDLEHDREQGLHSWATRFGERGVFHGARVFHVGTVALLAVAGLGLDVGLLYWLGVVAVAALLAYEHSLVRPGDLRRLDAAFFTVNGVISIVFLCFVARRRAPVIAARALEKRYGRRRALRPLDFRLERGGFLVVTGANGSGKTTLLRLVAGLAAPTRRRARRRRRPRRGSATSATSRCSTAS